MRIRLNPNKQIVEQVNEGLIATGGYCPCALEKNDDTKCMCKEFLTRQSTGPCHCGKFIKEEV